MKMIIIAFLSKFLVTFFPVKYYLHLIQSHSQNDTFEIDGNHIRESYKTLNRIKRVFPFSSNCLIKAIIFKYILAEYKIGSKIIFSLKKEDINRINAHAYLWVNHKYIFFKNDIFVDVYYG